MGNSFSSTTASSADGAEWFYSDQPALEDYLGTLNTRLLSVQGGEEDVANAERIERIGIVSDAFIDMALCGGDYVVPITVDGAPLNTLDDTHKTRALFRSFSNQLVAHGLNQHRMIISDGAEFDANLASIKNEVLAVLANIKSGEYQIEADLNEDEDAGSTVGVFRSVPISRRTVCNDDEYGAA